jgi:hypothetical protein
VNVYDTVRIYDTIKIEDTVHYAVYDSILVTDTLEIRVIINSLPSPGNTSTIKVFPVPANATLTINTGDYVKLNNYELRIVNSLGQTVWSTVVSQQEYSVNLLTIGESGMYYLQIFDANSQLVDVKKILFHKLQTVR